MFNGIFRRMLSTYLLIITLVVILLAVLLSQYMKEYLFQYKQDNLLKAGEQVNNLMVNYHRKEINKDFLAKSVNLIGRTTNARIIIIEKSGNNSDKSSLKDALSNQLAMNNQGQFFDNFDKVLAGQTIINRSQFTRKMNTYVLAVGIPIKVNKVITGAIILYSPVLVVKRTLDRVYKAIWLTALFALIIGFIIIFVISRRISRPIVEVSRNAVAIAQGKNVTDLTNISHDEIGQLIDSFNYMKNQLERTEKMREELFAGVSHDLRTPLTAIKGFIQGILDGVILPEDRQKYLELALVETNRLTRLTNDLLELAKLESEGLTLLKTKINISQVIMDVTETLLVEAKEKSITVNIKGLSKGIFIMADSDRLKQIFWNVLTNAIKFTKPEGYINISVETNLQTVKVEIADTGIGIPKEELEFIFEKFHRVDKSREAISGGTGLGLSIVKKLVELHEGEITITSALGEGTKVTIVLPINNL